MLTFFSIEFEPVRGATDKYSPRLLGFSTDPLLAMTDLLVQPVGELADSNPCVLFQATQLPGQFFKPDSKLNPNVRLIQKGLFPIGIKTAGRCIFFSPKMQDIFDHLFENLARYRKQQPINTDLRKRWITIGTTADLTLGQVLAARTPSIVSVKKAERKIGRHVR